MKKYCNNSKVEIYLNKSLLISYNYTDKEVEDFKIYSKDITLDIEDIVPIIIDVYPLDKPEILPSFDMENDNIAEIKMGTIIPKAIGETRVIVKTPGSLHDICRIKLKIKNRDVVNINANEIYNVDINDHNIVNNGTVECADKINSMLIWAKSRGYKKVVFPQGIYLVGALKSINMVSDLIVDMNGATFKKEPSNTTCSEIVSIPQGVKNCRLTNGTLYGDREGRLSADLTEVANGIHISGANVELDNVIITQIQGYGIFCNRGALKTLCYISRGNLIESSSNNWSTINYIDISSVSENFEICNPFGLGGLGGFTDTVTFNIKFYDENKKLLSETGNVKSYRLVQKHSDAKYVMIDMNNTTVPDYGNVDFGNSVAFICEWDYADNLYIHDCHVEYCKSLGLAYCADGFRNKIVNCIFSNNGGVHANVDVDFEDGWEFMRYTVMRDCEFSSSSSRSLVLCAGESLVFYNNRFNGGIVIEPRTQHTRFINNIFDCSSRASNDMLSGLTITTEWYSGAVFFEDNTFIKAKCYWCNDRAVENVHRFYFKDNYWKSCQLNNNSTHESFNALCVSNDTILVGKFENTTREDRTT